LIEGDEGPAESLPRRRPGSSNFGMGRSFGEVLRTHGAIPSPLVP
jgi:hypothetical protein